MVEFQVKLPGKEIARVVVCDARAFQRLVLIPQLFVFILLMVLGALLGQELLSNISRLSAITYLLLVNLVVQSLLKIISARFLGFHLLFLALLLAFLATFLRQDVLLGVYVPISCVLLSLIILPATLRVAAYLVIGSIAVCVAFAALTGLSGIGISTHHLHGLGLVLISTLVLILRQLVKRTGESALDPLPLSPIATGPSTIHHPKAEVSNLNINIRDEAKRIVADELRSDLLTQLPAALIILLCFVAIVFLRSSLDMHTLGYTITAAVLSLIATANLKKQRNERGLYFAAICVVLVSALWLTVVIQIPSTSSLVGEVGVLLFLLLFGYIPWPLLINLSLSSVLFLIVVVRAQQGVTSTTFVLIIALSLMVSVRSSAISFHALMTRATLLYIRRCIESGVSTALCVRLLAERLIEQWGAPRALLVSGTSQAEVVSGVKSDPLHMDSVYVRALLEKARVQGVDEGLLSVADLGQQFTLVLREWFAFVPNRILFARFAAVVNDKEQDFLIFIPLTGVARFIGVIRIFRSLLAVNVLVRSTLAAARSRFQSSDVLLTTQKNLSQRESELGEIVHFVNNIAQDISIQCDSVERNLGGKQQTPELEVIDNLARNLSTAVSDIRLLRELSRQRAPVRFDAVAVEAVVSELEAFGQYRRHRRGDNFKFVNKVESGTTVRVSNREYLETALRTLLRGCATRLSPGGHVLVQVLSDAQFVAFEIFDDAPKINFDTLQLFNLESEVESFEVKDLSYYGIIRSFFNASGGEFKIAEDCKEFKNGLICKLPIVEVRDRPNVALGRWALLVDDNPQVTNFYARVADALGLPYETAASLAEAHELLGKRGRPRIVITDIQLNENGSGLELVRDLRRDLGSELPIIVVSGQSRDDLGNEVNKVGATKFLTKPVSRAKLFSEIQELLGL